MLKQRREFRHPTTKSETRMSDITAQRVRHHRAKSQTSPREESDIAARRVRHHSRRHPPPAVRQDHNSPPDTMSVSLPSCVTACLFFFLLLGACLRAAFLLACSWCISFHYVQGFWHPFRPTWPGPVGSFLQPFQTDSVDGPRNRRARAVQKEIRFQGPGFESGLGPDTCWLTIFGGAIFEVRLPQKTDLASPSFLFPEGIHVHPGDGLGQVLQGISEVLQARVCRITQTSSGASFF